MARKVLIVGGVAGGATAAARLRRLEPDTQIILFERGQYISFANCGLPYYLGGVVPAQSGILVHTPDSLRAKYSIDVRTGHNVLSIDRAAKTVSVQPEGADAYTESYDILLLSPGASPVAPPIPGIDNPRVSTLWTIPDAERMRGWVRDGARSAVVVGGGFIGLEAAENLKEAGLNVQLVEMADQLLPPLDADMAKPVQEHLLAKGVDVLLRDGVSAIRQGQDHVIVTMTSGKGLRADMVLLAIGARPNAGLARAAGLDIGPAGGILVDDQLRTSDPSIFAVGDAAETRNIVTGKTGIVPLAGPANRQARIAAEVIAGRDEHYAGSQGTSIVKVFSMAAAATGLSEKALKKQGYVRGTDFTSITIEQNAHVPYYPGAEPLKLKLVFSMDGKKLYGAQAVGTQGVDKRIDVLATALRLGAGLDDLAGLELAYAPPFSTTRDIINTAATEAQKLVGKG